METMDEACSTSHTNTEFPGPSCLTREEVSCLKTACALAVVKRRLDQQHQQQMMLQAESEESHQVGNCHSSLCSFVTPPLTQMTTSTNSSNGTSSNVSRTHAPAPFIKTLAPHLDHMMETALRYRLIQAKSETYSSIITHVTGRLTSTLRHPNQIDAVAQWIYSYLVVLQQATAALWTDILYASQQPQQEDITPSSIIPDLLLKCLVELLQNILDERSGSIMQACSSTERRVRPKVEDSTADYYFILQLLSHTLFFASHDAVQSCWNELATEYTPWNYAVHYKESCRKRRLYGGMVTACRGDGTKTIMDASLLLWLRQGVSDVFADFIQSKIALND